jgi:hypothetical protein
MTPNIHHTITTTWDLFGTQHHGPYNLQKTPWSSQLTNPGMECCDDHTYTRSGGLHAFVNSYSKPISLPLEGLSDTHLPALPYYYICSQQSSVVS